ncbi:LysR family transcriptional regulator, partial [Thiomonas arsenitoxydans]|uniref:LysR family transcriptional regulator n=1 Tax=Thiomonas arsenitoxydans (strain DSM 22701 / CIP 110005 / 3As) TaxID=426114 RepID=UPI0023F46CA4
MSTNAFLSVLPEMVTFLRVAESGSFSAAARQLGTTPSAVSRQVSRLEKHLGIQLILRTTRQLRLTAAGDAARVRCGELVAAAQAVMQVPQQIAGTPKGSICISAPKALGPVNAIDAPAPGVWAEAMRGAGRAVVSCTTSGLQRGSAPPR